jgi:predicted metal-binding membrane protein
VIAGEPSTRDLPVRDRAGMVIAVTLLVVAIGAWIAVVAASPGHGDMADMPMPPVSFEWTGALAFVGAWTVMMTAMMLPSALPMIGLYGAIRRKGGRASGLPVAMFTLVYLAAWGVTGLPVYLATIGLGGVDGHVFAYGIAGVLVAAGVYQLSPLKHACLRACRSPIGFLLGRWRPGRAGGLVLAWRHAAYCVGCCWALMVVLVAAGAMGLPWVLLIAALVTAEKLAPGGEWIARAAGAALLLFGAAVAVRPDLIAMVRSSHMM